MGKNKIELPVAKYDNSRYFPPLPAHESNAVPVLLLLDNPITDQDPMNGERSSKTLKVLTQLLEKAKKSVRIFIPDGTLSSQFQEALEKCARRGVSVELITNSLKSHDLGKFAYFGSVGGYPSLTKAGVKTDE